MSNGMQSPIPVRPVTPVVTLRDVDDVSRASTGSTTSTDSNDSPSPVAPPLLLANISVVTADEEEKKVEDPITDLLSRIKDDEDVVGAIKKTEKQLLGTWIELEKLVEKYPLSPILEFALNSQCKISDKNMSYLKNKTVNKIQKDREDRLGYLLGLHERLESYHFLLVEAIKNLYPKIEILVDTLSGLKVEKLSNMKLAITDPYNDHTLERNNAINLVEKFLGKEDAQYLSYLLKFKRLSKLEKCLDLLPKYIKAISTEIKSKLDECIKKDPTLQSKNIRKSAMSKMEGL